MRADRNLFVPALGRRGATIPLGPQAGVNQFYIVETTYAERASGQIRCTLQLDNYADRASALLAQLKLAYDAATRRRGSYRFTLSPGVPVIVPFGLALSNQAAGGSCSIFVPWPGLLSGTPSVTVNVTSSSNATSVTATGASAQGVTVRWTTPAAGATSVVGTLTCTA